MFDIPDAKTTRGFAYSIRESETKKETVALLKEYAKRAGYKFSHCERIQKMSDFFGTIPEMVYFFVSTVHEAD